MQFARSSALRETLYRAYVTRASEFGDPALDNTRADPRDPRAAPGRSQPARLPQLRRAVRRAEDGRVARSRSSSSCANWRQGPPLRRARPRRPARIRGRQTRHRRSAALGLELHRRKAEGGALCLQRAGGQAVLHRAQGDGRPVQDRRDAVRGEHPARQRAGLAPERRGLPHRSARAPRSASSTSTRRPAPAKRGGAWMDDVRARWLRPDNGTVQTPVAQLVCNFASGVDGKPPLLTHDDVTTLFHEFGHGLHHMLTRVNERDVVGHQRRRVGCGRAAEPVHGELLLGAGRAPAHDRARRHRRAAAARAVRQDDRRQELPERPADAAPDRVLAVRHAAAHRIRRRAGPAGRRDGPARPRCAPRSP